MEGVITTAPGRTSLLVAHRLSTVERCDSVAFLEVVGGWAAVGGLQVMIPVGNLRPRSGERLSSC